MTKTHLLEYDHAGSRWLLELPASSEDDLRARIEAMRSGRYLGVEEISIPYRWRRFARVYAWFANTLGRVSR